MLGQFEGLSDAQNHGFPVSSKYCVDWGFSKPLSRKIFCTAYYKLKNGL
jgi:hypothetical protein